MTISTDKCKACGCSCHCSADQCSECVDKTTYTDLEHVCIVCDCENND
jgi:hypothetical protein